MRARQNSKESHEAQSIHRSLREDGKQPNRKESKNTKENPIKQGKKGEKQGTEHKQ